MSALVLFFATFFGMTFGLRALLGRTTEYDNGPSPWNSLDLMSWDQSSGATSLLKVVQKRSGSTLMFIDSNQNNEILVLLDGGVGVVRKTIFWTLDWFPGYHGYSLPRWLGGSLYAVADRAGLHILDTSSKTVSGPLRANVTGLQDFIFDKNAQLLFVVCGDRILTYSFQNSFESFELLRNVTLRTSTLSISGIASLKAGSRTILRATCYTQQQTGYTCEIDTLAGIITQLAQTPAILGRPWQAPNNTWLMHTYDKFAHNAVAYEFDDATFSLQTKFPVVIGGAEFMHLASGFAYFND
jgi:hypothetical protein